MWLSNPDAFWLNDLKVTAALVHVCASPSYRLLQPLTDRARAAVAEELGCSASSVALVDNATQGMRLRIASVIVELS
jgi:selenocysteine lyase/cysteine desulfurase